MATDIVKQAAIDHFARLGGELVDPPTVMDAALPLDLSGEAVRARLCIFPDAEGHELALRPDLTLPVALRELELRWQDDPGAAIRRYGARAYRLPAKPGDPVEFTQVGFERFAAPVSPDIDAQTLAEVCAAIDAAGAETGHAWLGDLSVFPAFVDALALDASTAGALKRAFRQQGGVHDLLDRAGSDTTGAGSRFAARISGADQAEAEAIVGDMLALSGVAPVGGRSLDEIVERLREKAATGAGGGVPGAAAEILRTVLAVEAAPGAAVDRLGETARSAGLDGVDPVLDQLSRRVTLIDSAVPGLLAKARFGTPFGRRFNYYDGFVFELFANAAPASQPFGAGGRYDQLLARLSGQTVSTSAIGGVVRPDRLSLAIGDTP